MTMSIAQHVEVRPQLRGLLPVWVGLGVYALLLAVGDQLLNDPDTYWQVTIGQWTLDNHALPRTDIYSFTMHGQPWISTQWLAQVLYALAYDLAGWAGPVILASAAAALALALLTRFLGARLSRAAVLVLVTAAMMLMASHLLARPHVLAMPVMMAWVAGLIDAMDRKGAPSLWLLPLMTLWANLHGGFVLGLALIGPIALDAILNASKPERRNLLLRWTLFGVAALAASCVTPYGWEALMASRRILSLGAALALIGEWRAADFGHAGPLEGVVLAGLAFALWRGITLSPMRVVLVLGFTYMALSHVRNAEVLALLAPLVLAKPLGEQVGRDSPETTASSPPLLRTAIAMLAIAATFLFASMRHYTPSERMAPVAAVNELKKLDLSRVFNDYNFGGYLIWRDVPTFIDGRTELFGEKLVVDHHNASGLMQPDKLFQLLRDYNIEATLLSANSAAAKLLDRVDGWQKVYGDDLAIIHVRKAGAISGVAPTIKAD